MKLIINQVTDFVTLSIDKKILMISCVVSLLFTTLVICSVSIGDFEDGIRLEARKDYVGAFELFQKAAEDNNAVAQYKLGTMYFNGRGIAQDLEKAASLYRKAALMNISPAQHELGLMYSRGDGVVQDYQQAMTQFDMGMLQGNPKSLYMKGVLHENGLGVPRNQLYAIALYQKASKQGFTPGPLDVNMELIGKVDFSETLPIEMVGVSLTNGGRCNLDYFNGTPIGNSVINTMQGESFRLLGWVADKEHHAVADVVFIWLQMGNKVLYSKADKNQRPDIGIHLGNPVYSDAGFQLNAEIDTLLPGIYMAHIVLVNQSGALLCKTGTKIKVDLPPLNGSGH